MPFRWEGVTLAAAVLRHVGLVYLAGIVLAVIVGGVAAFLAKQVDY